MPPETLLSQFHKGQKFKSGHILVDHHLVGEPEILREYLESKPYPKNIQILQDLISEESELIVPITEPVENFYQLSHEDVGALVISRIHPIQEIADLSLSFIFEDSFNRHGLDHVNSVASKSIQLLKEFGIDDEQTIRRAIVAGLGHDLGTLKSRRIHSVLSPDILASLIPELKQNLLEWRKIRKAIYLHNPPIFEEYLDGICGKLIERANNASPHQIESELITELRNRLDPVVFSTIIADTTDIRTARASTREDLTTDNLDRNRHLALTFNTNPIEIGYDQEDQSTFSWLVEFADTFPNEALSRQYARFGEKDMPSKMHLSKLYNEFGEGDSFDGWFRAFVETHGPRFRHVAISAFVLDRKLEEFTFKAKYQGREMSVTIQRPDIAKKSIPEQLEEIFTKYKPREIIDEEKATLSLR